MKIFDKVSKWLNKIYKKFGKFTSENWFAYWAVLVVVAAGGFMGYFLGWAFSLFVPAWCVFVGWMFKTKYEKSQ
jgi:asparagine N-glycosylation enzyme membrane subunit Stt3